MASLDILDGNGIAQNLLVTVAGADLVPHHIIESGTVTTVTGVTTVSTVTNLSQLGGVAVAMGTGTRSAGTQRVTIATDDSVPVTGTFWQATQPVSLTSTTITGSVAVTGTFFQATQPVSIAATVTVTGTGGTFPVTDSGGSLTVDNGGTFAVQVSSALPSGTNNIGDVDVLSLPALPAGTNNIGDVDVLTVPALVASTATIGDVGLVGRTTGGLTMHSRLSTGTDSTNVKASAGQVFWGFVTNTNASARYIKFYNSASAPTLGSGTPVARMMIPPGSSGLQITAEQGLAFSTGIGYTLSTGAADSDTGTVAANEVIVNLGYR
jgi:P pilus assembly chaperone PapD